MVLGSRFQVLGKKSSALPLAPGTSHLAPTSSSTCHLSPNSDFWALREVSFEVGTGFHPELTGRANVYLSGAILGMTKREIDQKFDEIVAFAGVEKIFDTPVTGFRRG